MPRAHRRPSSRRVTGNVPDVRVDLGLDVAVGEFVEALTPLLEHVYRQSPSGEPSKATGDVVNEAFNLSTAFIDADGLATDAELLSLLHTFAPLIDTSFATTSPDQARGLGITTRKRAFLSRPSDLFEILLELDRRAGTSYSTIYMQHALAIAHMVASIDAHTSRSELLAIEDFRGLLLARVKDAPLNGRPVAGGDQPHVRSGTGTRTRSGGESSRPEQGGGSAVATPDGTDASSADHLADALPPERPLDDLLEELEGLVGMTAVKAEVKLVANLIKVQNLRKDRNLPVHETSRHLIFTGNPGTGKTTVARLLAQIYRTLRVVERGHLVETDRSGLVVGYVGQTATKVTEVFDQADGGVLLIDEAYALVRGSEQDFGKEAIDTIVKLVEDRRDRVVVIAAGYPDEMGDFVGANPGLASRFPKTISFPDYTTDELVRIFESLGAKSNYCCDAEARELVRAHLDAIPREKGFGNGRLARNLFEEAIARQATRLVALENPTDDQLLTLTAADIPTPGGQTTSDTPATQS